MHRQKVIGIIQARLGSTRLPGKVLADIYGKPMLAWMLTRLAKAKSLDQIVIATTTSTLDDRLHQWVLKNTNFDCFRGSEMDLVERFYECAGKYQADVIVRLTADDPLKDGAIIDRAVELFFENKKVDYVSNCLKATYPEGLDVEVFSYKALSKVHNEAYLLSDREHLTSYMTNNPKVFSLLNFEYEEKLEDWRWTVDKPADLKLMHEIFDRFKDKPCADFREIIAFVKQRPDLLKINQGTKRFEGYLQSVEREKYWDDN